jgi:hypothetical protein
MGAGATVDPLRFDGAIAVLWFTFQQLMERRMDYQKMLFACYVRDEVMKRIEKDVLARNMDDDQKTRYEAEVTLGFTIEVLDDINVVARIVDEHGHRAARGIARTIPPGPDRVPFD